MTAPGGAVAIRGVHKSFGPHPVLRGVDLTVPSGSVTAILGSSGSGKTTLLRIIAGFERPDAGTVTIGGVTVADDRTDVPVERRRIGYVSQEGSLFPHLDVRANVGFGLARRHRRGAAVDELLKVVGLEDFGRRYPHELSGGQQQRVALARTLATGPELVLLDEPFAALDANMRASVRAEVFAILRSTGTTAVLVTHDQDEALSTADLVAVLRRGTIAQVGAPQGLYNHPVDADLARFVGEANLIGGTAHDGVVDTGLGALRPWRAVPAGDRRVTVLVRPEQIVLSAPGDAAGAGAGARARVISTDYHGHDATVRLEPEDPGLPSPVVARVSGGLRVAPGTAVAVAVSGAVEVWPDPGITGQPGDAGPAQEPARAGPPGPASPSR